MQKMIKLRDHICDKEGEDFNSLPFRSDKNGKKHEYSVKER